jgi:hypothetical protein
VHDATVPYRWLFLCAALMVWPACTTARDAAVPLVRVRAEKDLRCTAKQIDIEPQLGGRYVASGCGRTVTYDSVCEQLRCSVAREGEEAPAWRDRPEPGSVGYDR